MNRIYRAVASLALAATLTTGCTASDPEPEDRDYGFSTDSSLGQPSNLSQKDMDSLFVAFMRSNEPAMFLGVEDEQVVDLARAMCDYIDRGADFQDIAMSGLEAGFDPDEVSTLVGAGIATYCPENGRILE